MRPEASRQWPGGWGGEGDLEILYYKLTYTFTVRFREGEKVSKQDSSCIDNHSSLFFFNTLMCRLGFWNPKSKLSYIRDRSFLMSMGDLEILYYKLTYTFTVRFREGEKVSKQDSPCIDNHSSLFFFNTLMCRLGF